MADKPRKNSKTTKPAAQPDEFGKSSISHKPRARAALAGELAKAGLVPDGILKALDDYLDAR